LNGQISGWNSILWGITEEDRPVGFASLSSDDQDRTRCTYTIVLHPSVRNKGLGGLATAGVVQTGLKDFALQDVSLYFDGHMSGIDTAIHSDNRVSRIMCERAGFKLVEGEYHYINRANFLSYLCTEPAQQPITVLAG
jgi:RimJ/RimL family protein N-acetyltransferase